MAGEEETESTRHGRVRFQTTKERPDNKNLITPLRVMRQRSGSERDRSVDLTIFSRTLYQLSYRANQTALKRLLSATRVGLEPMTSAVTGRRSNQLSYRASAALAATCRQDTSLFAVRKIEN